MNTDALMAGALAAAEEGGDLLLGFLGHLESVEYKGEVDLVTEADRESERFLVERLSQLTPEASILAEEGSGVQRDSDLRWIVDPLDGTTNFAHGYPIFCISIALERNGECILGIVHDPTRKESFVAIRGEGAHRNGESIRVSEAGTLGESLLVTGFPYDVHTAARNNLTQFGSFLRSARAVRRDGSAALDLAYVAAGRFDGFWEEGLAPWDIAAGALLVEEAGGLVTGYRGEPGDLGSGNIVASNGHIHEAMVEILSEIEDRGDLPPLTTRARRDS
jgi:myo-inositol-1(or 4)-monophosphatase